MKFPFEKNFAPLAGCQVSLVTEDRPSPFRAWFAAAVGLPIGALLLFGYMVKIYGALFMKGEKKETAPPQIDEPLGRMERLITRISRFDAG